MAYLFLNELSLLSFEQFLRNTLRAILRAHAQLPQLLAEARGIFLEESSQLNLYLLYLWLLCVSYCSWDSISSSVTHVSGGFNQVETQLNHDVILCAQDL